MAARGQVCFLAQLGLAMGGTWNLAGGKGNRRASRTCSKRSLCPSGRDPAKPGPAEVLSPGCLSAGQRDGSNPNKRRQKGSAAEHLHPVKSLPFASAAANRPNDPRNSPANHVRGGG